MNKLHVYPTVEFDRLKYDVAKDLYTMVSIRAPSYVSEERATRSSIDMVCVIDKSGSMAGNKITLVKNSLAFMIGQLKENDRLALVTFDANVELVLALERMTEERKKEALQIVSKIRAGTTTNLSGGLFEGYQVLKNRTDPQDVSSILLFTDGLANNGITVTNDIVRGIENVQQSMTKVSSVFGFGFGSDHDANMVRAISEAGNGLYYYMENEDMISQAFADCLGGLLSVSAQNIKLNVTPVGDVKLVQVHSKYKQTVTETGVELSIGDLYSDEQRDIVLQVHVDESPVQKAQEVVSFKITYFDVINLTYQDTFTTAVIERSEGESSTCGNIDLDTQRARVETINALEKARELGDAGRLEEARTVLETMVQKLSVTLSANNPLVIALVQDLNEAISKMQSQDQFTKYGSKIINSQWSSNTRQRSNNPTSQYSTTSKSEMSSRVAKHRL